MSHSENVDPARPEPPVDATQRLSIGVPAAPSSSDLKADSTLKVPLGMVAPPALDQTQKMVVPRLDDPPIRRLKVDSPAEAEGQAVKAPAPPQERRSFGWKLPAALVLLVVAGVGGFLFWPRGTVASAARPSASAPAADSVPKDVQILIDQAKAGDTRAMRMLGAYYLHGLNVPKDREKGLYYYRMAAEKGSDAAKAELSQIEGGR